VSGGAYFIEYNASCQWTEFVQLMQHNHAASGNDMATFPEEIIFDWKIMDSFSRTDILHLDIELYDGFNQRVRKLANGDLQY